MSCIDFRRKLWLTITNPRDGSAALAAASSSAQVRTSSRLDPAKRAVSAHHAGASPDRKSQWCDGRLPSSKRKVLILQLWCSLNVCTSIVDLHRANFWDHGGRHGQESEEGKEEVSEKEKEVTVQRNLIASG
jgi:hypothetical protein